MRAKDNRCLHSRGRGAVATAAVLTVALAAAIPAVAAGTGAASREYEVKAAFLYSFATFVEWPEDAVPESGGTFIIGVLGTDPFGPLLDKIAASKTVRGKPIAVRRFATIDDYTPCHVLFVARSERERLPAIVERLRGAAVLVVGDGAGFAEAGATVNLVIEKNKVRFEINQAAAERAGLKVSSKLLRLARHVKDKAEAEETPVLRLCRGGGAAGCAVPRDVRRTDCLRERWGDERGRTSLTETGRGPTVRNGLFGRRA